MENLVTQTEKRTGKLSNTDRNYVEIGQNVYVENLVTQTEKRTGKLSNTDRKENLKT